MNPIFFIQLALVVGTLTPPIAARSDTHFRISPVHSTSFDLADGKADCWAALHKREERAGGGSAGANNQVHQDALWMLERALPGIARSAFEAAPEDFIRWSKAFGNGTLVSLTVAYHETLHTINRRATHCSHGRFAVFFAGRIYSTSLRFGDSLPMGIAAAEVPVALRSTSPFSRYRKYLVVNGSNAYNDFTVLIDELSTYVSGGQLELALMSCLECKAKGLEIPDQYDGNATGTAELMLYTAAYLRALEMNAPSIYRDLKAKPELIEFLTTVWGVGEENTLEMCRRARQGDQRLLISRAALAALYSGDLIGQLRDFGIRMKTDNVPC